MENIIYYGLKEMIKIVMLVLLWICLHQCDIVPVEAYQKLTFVPNSYTLKTEEYKTKKYKVRKKKIL